LGLGKFCRGPASRIPVPPWLRLLPLLITAQRLAVELRTLVFIITYVEGGRSKHRTPPNVGRCQGLLPYTTLAAHVAAVGQLELMCEIDSDPPSSPLGMPSTPLLDLKHVVIGGV
jgi:hypothetical protein